MPGGAAVLVQNWMTRDVITIDADQSMQEAIYTMQDRRIRLLPVLDKGGLVGIVSDRDLKKASPSDASTLDVHEMLYLVARIRVRDVMTRKVITIPLDYTVEEAAAILLEKRISGLPVVAPNGELAGIITGSDIFRLLISMTGFGRRGIQFAVRMEDTPDAVHDVLETVRKFGGRTSSMLSATDASYPGKLTAYFRIYQLERARLSELVDEVGKLGAMLYVVDLRENKRTIYAA